MAELRDSTYVQCYGIKDSYTKDGFTPRSDLILKNWGRTKNNRRYLKVSGQWHDHGRFATSENYFTVEALDGKRYPADEIADRLRELTQCTLAHNKSELYSKHVKYFACDLTEPQARVELLAAITSWGIGVTALVNNAGIGSNGAFLEMERENEIRQINLNVVERIL